MYPALVNTSLAPVDRAYLLATYPVVTERTIPYRFADSCRVCELWLKQSQLVLFVPNMPGTITALVAQKKNPDRVNVYLDGKFAFGLAAIEAVRLRRGQVLTDADVERLQAADDIEKAREKALRFLSNRPRSEWEVRQNLLKTGYGDATIDRVLERLRGVALVDDAAFARYWIENRTQFRPRGEVALRQELRRKGVDREVIDAVLDESEHAEDQAAIQAALAKADRYRQLPRPEFAQKLGAYLARRGFDYETVREAVQVAWQTVHADEPVTHFDELEE